MKIMLCQLQDIWYRIQRTSKPKAQRTSKPKTQSRVFYNLPTELIHEITTYLPASSKVSFALTSRTMKYILGQHILEELKADGKELHTFLSILDKDLPKHFYCDGCESLHSIFRTEGENSEWETRNLGYLKCLSYYPSGSKQYVSLSYCCVSQRDVCLALKRHHYGRTHGIGLENFGQFHSICDTVYKFQAKIISDEFYIREEIQVKISPTYLEIQFAHPTGLCIHLRNHIFLCNNIQDWHTRMTDSLTNGQFHQHYLCAASHHAEKDCMICSGVKQCPACFMEYTITKQGEHAITAVAWYNLGTGRRLDKKWRSHVCTTENNSYFWQPVSFAPESISEAWKQEESSVRKA
jgi:hypothetical protein